MIPMKKVEMVIEQIQIEQVVTVISQLDISGYTLIRDVAGSGSHGLYDSQEISDIFHNSYFIIVCNQEKMESLIHKLKPLLQNVTGTIFVSEVMWVKH